ncbi:hypothetical protein RCL1_008363 [Eukaryota sp. TZLM3-RCL]
MIPSHCYDLLEHVLHHFLSLSSCNYATFREVFCQQNLQHISLYLDNSHHFAQTFPLDILDGPLDELFFDPEYSAIQTLFSHIICTYLLPSYNVNPEKFIAAIYLLYSLFFTQLPPLTPIIFPIKAAQCLKDSARILIESNKDALYCLGRLFSVGAICITDVLCPPYKVEHGEKGRNLCSEELLSSCLPEEAFTIEMVEEINEAAAKYLADREELIAARVEELHLDSEVLCDLGTNFLESFKKSLT